MKIKKRLTPYLILCVLTLFFCWLFAGRFGVFGSEIDWLSQHSVIPDYFRKQFYETGKLIPEFAPSLGGGQNIYNFAYYGLFSPLILPSYLLPFVKMSTYIMAVSILTLIASVLLFYYWTGTHNIPEIICFGTAVLFLLAGPMIFQSYRQIMFVNYMPFLILALIGTDQFWKKGHTMLMTTGIFLMIMTSFYFSICGMLVVFIYGISAFQISQEHKIIVLLRFISPFFIAVFTSAFLLVPTASAILVRSNKGDSASIMKFFMPEFSLKNFIYTGYGMGISSCILIVLILGIFIMKKPERIMCIATLIVLSVPFFSWILNGGLYVRAKAFIPFLPLCCYLSSVFLTETDRYLQLFFNYKIPHFKSIKMPNIFAVFMLIPLLFYLLIAGFYLNISSGFIPSKELYKELCDSSWETEINSAATKEKGLYRLEEAGTLNENKNNINRIRSTRQWTTTLYSSAYNQEYQHFLTDTFQAEIPYNNAVSHATSSNPLFRKLMGVKRLISRNSEGDFSTELLPSAAPVLYATDHLISSDDYKKLSFPYNQTALMTYAVINHQTSEKGMKKGIIKDSAAPTRVGFSESRTVYAKGDCYHIKADKKSSSSLFLSSAADAEKQLLFLQFDVENLKKNLSVYIEVNGIRNKLSAEDHIYYNNNTAFTFVTKLKKGQKELPVVFSKGDYVLSNIRAYTGSDRLLTDTTLYQSEFIPDWSRTKGNLISGKIDVANDGYMISSIPFDKNFEIYVDHQAVPPRKVNTAFLGFPVARGKHQIRIIYHAPGLALGKILSVFGLFLWGVSFGIHAANALKHQKQRNLRHQPLIHRPKGSLVQ